MTSPCDPAADVYAQRWGMLVELEAAASAVEGNDSRVLFDVPITWAGKKERRTEGQRLGWTDGRSLLLP